MKEDKLPFGMIKESSMIQLQTAREQIQTAIDMVNDGLAGDQMSKLLTRLLNAQANLAVIEASMTLTLDNAWLWPEPPVPEISRQNLDTHYSLDSLNNITSGLFIWRHEWCYVFAWDEHTTGKNQKFWMCPISDENAATLITYNKAHAVAFKPVRWNRDGSRTNEGCGTLGEYCTIGFNLRAYEWHIANPKPIIHELLPKDSPIVGWFKNWRDQT